MAGRGRYVEVAGHSYWVIEAGEGAPLLLLHGGFDSSDAFFATLGEPLASSRRVIAFDRVGHGRTADRDRPFHYAEMADDAAALIRVLGLDAVDLCGWSDGGIVALCMALQHRQLLRRMVLIGANFHHDVLPAGFFDPAAPWLEAVGERYAALSPDGPGHFAGHVGKTFALWGHEPAWSPADLSGITTPTLVLNGDRDELIPIGHTVALFEAIAAARLAIVPGAGHFVAGEEPALTQALVSRFLDADLTR